jgi:hypothetical protein
MSSTPDTREVLCCPTGLLPIGLSLGALLIVLLHVAFFGADSAPDEGAAAHVWQILMFAQIPALTLFVGRWFRIARRPALRVLALHGAAIILSVTVAAAAPVYFLHL